MGGMDGMEGNCFFWGEWRRFWGWISGGGLVCGYDMEVLLRYNTA